MQDLNIHRSPRSQAGLRNIGAVLALIILFFASWTTLKSHDTFGYLAMGKAFWEGGKSLFTDSFSITHQGERLLPNPWLFSLISGGAETIGGTKSLFALFTILWSAPIVLLAVWSKKRNVDGVAVFVAGLFLTAAFLTRVQLRPELVAYTFLISAIILAHRYSLDGRWPALAAMAGLFVLWTQFHSTSSMMLPIFGATWFQRLLIDLKNVNNGSRLRLFAVHLAKLSAFLFVGFLNPNGFNYHPFALASVHQNEWLGVIAEYAGNQRFVTIIQWLNLIGGCILLVLLFNIGDLAKVGILAVMLFYAIQIPKLAPHVSIVLAAIALIYLEGAKNSDYRSPSVWTVLFRIPAIPHIKNTILAIVFVATLVQLFQQFIPLSQASVFMGAPEIDEELFAVDVARFIKEKNLAGPTLSELGTAGYLEYAIGSPFTTYVDQRIGILIPKSIFDSYREAIMREKNLVELVNKFGITALVGSNGWPERLNDTALRTQKFSILYVGQSHSLFVSTSSGMGYDQISWLMHDPACLKHVDPKKLSAERARLAEDTSVSGERLRQIADTALGLLEKQVDPSKFNDQLSNPHVLRLVAFYLRDAGQPESALKTQQSLKSPANLIDYLESALALNALGANDIALQALFNAGPDYYYGSRQKAAQFLYVVDRILSKLPNSTPTPSWLEGLRNALARDRARDRDREPEGSASSLRRCRPTS